MGSHPSSWYPLVFLYGRVLQRSKATNRYAPPADPFRARPTSARCPPVLTPFSFSPFSSPSPFPRNSPSFSFPLVIFVFCSALHCCPRPPLARALRIPAAAHVSAFSALVSTYVLSSTGPRMVRLSCSPAAIRSLAFRGDGLILRDEPVDALKLLLPVESLHTPRQLRAWL